MVLDNNIILGFIGTGKITTAVVNGYLSNKANKTFIPNQIIISPRSTIKSQLLKEKYPNNIIIANDNQDVINRSNIIYIGLSAEVAREILPSLDFSSNKLVLSMMASINYNELINLINNNENTNCICHRFLPLPAQSERLGPILYYPPGNELAIELYNEIGTAIPCNSENEMNPLITMACLISPFYQIQSTLMKWCESKGIDENVAGSYIGSLWHSLANGSKEYNNENGNLFEELANEAATPGGLNETSLNFLTERDTFSHFTDASELIYNILNK